MSDRDRRAENEREWNAAVRREVGPVAPEGPATFKLADPYRLTPEQASISIQWCERCGRPRGEHYVPGLTCERPEIKIGWPLITREVEARARVVRVRGRRRTRPWVLPQGIIDYFAVRFGSWRSR